MIKELMLCGLLTLSPVKMANNDIKQPKPRMALHDELTWEEYQRTLENRWTISVDDDYITQSQSFNFDGLFADLFVNDSIVNVSMYSVISYDFNLYHNILRLTHNTYYYNYSANYEHVLTYFNYDLGDEYVYYELDYFIYVVTNYEPEFYFESDYTYLIVYYGEESIDLTSSTQLSYPIVFDFYSVLQINSIIDAYMQLQFDGLENEYDNLQEIYNELVNNTIILEQDYERLQADFEELTTQYNELLRDYNSLEIGNAELLQQIRDLNTEISLLNDYIAVLEMQIDGVFENVFKWFEDTFDAFARVLDYEILPNIKIAYLFALPIIAAAIYFVVKVTIA